MHGYFAKVLLEIYIFLKLFSLQGFSIMNLFSSCINSYLGKNKCPNDIYRFCHDIYRSCHLLQKSLSYFANFWLNIIHYFKDFGRIWNFSVLDPKKTSHYGDFHTNHNTWKEKLFYFFCLLRAKKGKFRLNIWWTARNLKCIVISVSYFLCTGGNGGHSSFLRK